VNAAPRLDALRARLESDPTRGVLVSRASNVAYITGFEGVFDEEEAHVAAVSTTGATLYTDSRYAASARAAAVDSEWEVVTARERVLEEACSALRGAGVGWIGVESTVPHNRFLEAVGAFEGAVESVSGWVETLRCVKEHDEIARIIAAQRLTDQAFDHILGFIAVGQTEHDIALELEFFMRARGSQGVAFQPIVASGPNSALPHAKPTQRHVARGDFLKLDFGAKVDGYCADMTRTIVVGRASERQVEIYEAVLAANLAGISALKAGEPGKEVDAAARRVIAKRGFAEYFGHGLGHGVGLEVHELPGLGPRSSDPVPEASVVTVEPGIYIPGYGGVRIEDLVVVERDCARVLTMSPKALIEL